MRGILWRGLAALTAALVALADNNAAQAQSKSRLGEAVEARGVNDATINIITGTPNGTYLLFAYDMAAVLDSTNLRILGIIGKGGGQNVSDILHLKGIDLGITQTDILSHFRRSGVAGANIADRLVYVTKLYNEELHLVTSRSINSLDDLNNKVVSFGEAGSSADISGRLIFEILGVKVTPVNMNQVDALLAIKSGQIAATLMLEGKPLSILSAVKETDGLRLIGVPYTQALEDEYLPASLSSQDYPGLVHSDQLVETVAVGAVLAAYNWPKNTERYQRVARLVGALFNRLAEFQKSPRHPKWKEVNLAAKLPGWKRFPAATEWLDGTYISAATGAAKPPELTAPARSPATNSPR
jgi:uncharacterized protein